MTVGTWTEFWIVCMHTYHHLGYIPVISLGEGVRRREREGGNETEGERGREREEREEVKEGKEGRLSYAW